ncbi:MAG: hypothetical protein CO113_16535 [Elusimicrobia bacterium CG_4_9_14_3_um_filter_62_55]|nr:MAG: hypothetical protein COR54_06680 [Elusimicrobia bacterium CG22_combo_CG10-13_8_21_14_all_63_91]PJA17269.1 MAG: hypothetical protein COX66_05130 [Elusimicrobia bacterium CG_4_10_14_0_2_um_filter_63_34]PJB23850.1 MAG: hypothetical protein CO113_16535 [Elusimicrobia bacterium CG_4_9_14_3_um_filter_62_55]
MPKRDKRAHFRNSGPSPRSLLGRRQAPARAITRRAAAVYGGLALAAVLLLVGNRGFRTIISGHFQLRRLNAEMTRLEREEAELQARIDAVQHDDWALERVVRKQLGFRRDREIEYRFPPPPPEERFR